MHFVAQRRVRAIAACTALASILLCTVLVTDAWPDTETTPPIAVDDEAAPLNGVSAVAPNVACSQSSRGFENPIVGYALCYPSSWGFTDFTTMGPLNSVPARWMRGLHLVSANAFPWVVGTRSFDAIRRGVVDVELGVRQPGVLAEGECEPPTPGAPGIAWCEQHYDVLGLPAASGPVRALKFELPLDGDARLLVIARMADGSEEVQTVWDLVRSIRLV